MSASHQRNRIVVFRLSQSEYQHLKTACDAAGGRSLSDFTRSELLSLVAAGSPATSLDRRIEEINNKLANLYALIQRLSDRIGAQSLA